MVTVRKTTTVTTVHTVVEDGKDVTKTETTTTTVSEGDAAAVAAAEVEIDRVRKAMDASSAAMGKVFEGLSERMDAVFAPLRDLGKKKP